MARGTCDTKIEVIECQFPLCISLLCGGGGGVVCYKGFAPHRFEVFRCLT
jgi:hypothetical protein